MNTFEITLLASVIVGFLVILVFLKKYIQINQPESTEHKRLLQGKRDLEVKLSESDKQNERLRSDLNLKEILLEDRNKRIHTLETDLKQNKKELSDEIKELSYSKQQFQGEQARVRKADEEKQKEEKENQSRIWNDHEEKALTFMKDVCEKKDIKFSYYSNTDLPSGFPGNLKPDFMVQVIDQYAIFDAKLSKSSNINNYIKNQVKQSASKYKKHNSIIFPFVFFVIPTISISEIKETYFYHEKFHFYVITVEAFEPIIRSLKKLEDYSFTEGLDPENREKVVYSIALLSRHVKEQNAANLLGTTYGLKTLNELQELPADIVKEVENKEENISFETFNLKLMKEIRSSTEKQKEMLIDFIKPQKPAIEIEELIQAEKEQGGVQ